MKRSAASPACPCGSGSDYGACCGRWHAGAPAPSAEVLMRSRYCAYVRDMPDYLLATWHADTRPDADSLNNGIKTQWLGLDVLRHETESEHAVVEFVARYKINGRAGRMREVSRFERVDGRWYYRDGDVAGCSPP